MTSLVLAHCELEC